MVETHPIQYHAPIYRYLQQRLDVPVTVVYGSDHSIRGYLDEEFGVRLAWDTDLLSGYSPVFTDPRFSAIRAALLEARPAAVMVVGYSPGFHRRAFAAALSTHLPILFRGETTDHAVRRGRLKRGARAAALSWLYRRCARLLYVGARSHEHFLSIGVDESRLAFSPYCVDAGPFRVSETDRAALRDVTRKELGIKPDDVALLFSGKLSPRKGPDLLLDAVRLLPGDIRARVVLLFLGDGELRSALASAGDGGVRVNLLGFRNQLELSPYYHAADLLVLPSRHSETWGLVVNEALHHGLPCVVSDAVGAAPDLVHAGVSGEQFTAGRAEALAAAIQRALPLAGRADVRDACRATVSRFSLDRAAEGIASALAAATAARA